MSGVVRYLDPVPTYARRRRPDAVQQNSVRVVKVKTLIPWRSNGPLVKGRPVPPVVTDFQLWAAHLAGPLPKKIAWAAWRPAYRPRP